MSLKAIHILVITMATLLSLSFGVWCVQSYLAESNLLHLSLGVVSFLAAGGLVIYGVWFVRKLRREGML